MTQKTIDTTSEGLQPPRPREAHQTAGLLAVCANCKHIENLDKDVGLCGQFDQFRALYIMRECVIFCSSHTEN